MMMDEEMDFSQPIDSACETGVAGCLVEDEQGCGGYGMRGAQTAGSLLSAACRPYRLSQQSSGRRTEVPFPTKPSRPFMKWLTKMCASEKTCLTLPLFEWKRDVPVPACLATCHIKNIAGLAPSEAATCSDLFRAYVRSCGAKLFADSLVARAARRPPAASSSSVLPHRVMDQNGRPFSITPKGVVPGDVPTPLDGRELEALTAKVETFVNEGNRQGDPVVVQPVELVPESSRTPPPSSDSQSQQAQLASELLQVREMLNAIIREQSALAELVRAQRANAALHAGTTPVLVGAVQAPAKKPKKKTMAPAVQQESSSPSPVDAEPSAQQPTLRQNFGVRMPPQLNQQSATARPTVSTQSCVAINYGDDNGRGWMNGYVRSASSRGSFFHVTVTTAFHVPTSGSVELNAINPATEGGWVDVVFSPVLAESMRGMALKSWAFVQSKTSKGPVLQCGSLFLVYSCPSVAHSANVLDRFLTQKGVAPSALGEPVTVGMPVLSITTGISHGCLVTEMSHGTARAGCPGSPGLVVHDASVCVPTLKEGAGTSGSMLLVLSNNAWRVVGPHAGELGGFNACAIEPTGTQKMPSAFQRACSQ